MCFLNFIVEATFDTPLVQDCIIVFLTSIAVLHRKYFQVEFLYSRFNLK